MLIFKVETRTRESIILSDLQQDSEQPRMSTEVQELCKLR